MTQVSIFPTCFISGVSCGTTTSPLPHVFFFALLSQKWQCLQLWEKPNVDIFFFLFLMGEAKYVRFPLDPGRVVWPKSHWNSEDRNSTSRLTLPFTLWQWASFLSYSVFISVNLQSQSFSPRKLFRSHQNPALLAYDYLGHETQRNIVLPHCPTSGTYLGFCEDQNE